MCDDDAFWVNYTTLDKPYTRRTNGKFKLSAIIVQQKTCIFCEESTLTTWKNCLFRGFQWTSKLAQMFTHLFSSSLFCLSLLFMHFIHFSRVKRAIFIFSLQFYWSFPLSINKRNVQFENLFVHLITLTHIFTSFFYWHGLFSC